MRVLIAAGGTGGHIIPAIAVADAIKAINPAAEVTFVGIGKPIEAKLVGQAGYVLKTVAFRPVLGAGPLGILKLLMEFPKAVNQSVQLLRKVQPDVVIGFGGFPSFVPFLTSVFFAVPRILHEQNARVGLANKILSLFATKVMGVTDAKGFLRQKGITLLPNPVRQSFYAIPDFKLPKPGQPLTVLIVGGSQGAVSVNTAVLALTDFFENHDVTVIHQAGKTDVQRVSEAYKERNFHNAQVLEFIDSIDKAYAAAHLVICRAGAMTVAEVSAAGRPAIFIPLSIAGGHQADNVKSLCQAGGALSLQQDESLVIKLRQTMQDLISKPERLEKMAAAARNHAMSAGEPSAKAIARIASDLVRSGTA